MTASDDDLIQKGQDDLIRRGDARRILDEEGFLERSLANLNNLPAVQVAVTPLQFIYGKAESIIGIYLIDSGWKDKVGGDLWWAWAGPTVTDNDRDPFYVWQHGAIVADEEAAKAAAQADYEARIRSALTVTTHDQAKVDTFYIDCEFDGHDGPLLSIAMVRGDGYSLHVEVIEEAKDPWVIANVMPIMGAHKADVMRVAKPNYVGSVLRQFIGDCAAPTIIADSHVDIGRFCRAISTGKDGKWQSADFPKMNFVVHNVDCYPTTLDCAVQHNAWWDAMALRAALARVKGGAA